MMISLTIKYLTVTPQKARKRISRTEFSKFPGGHASVTPLGFCLQPLSSQTWIRPDVLLWRFIVMARDSSNSLSFEIGIGGKGNMKFCELISRQREKFGIADRYKPSANSEIKSIYQSE